MRKEILAPVRRSRKKKFFLRFFFFALSVAIFLAAIFSSTFFIKSLRISDIKIEGAVLLSETEIREEVENILDEKMLGIIPRDNIFFLPEKVLGDGLAGRFKRIKNISVDGVFPSSLLVAIAERKAEAIVCFGSRGECYFVDEGGLAFEEAPYFSAGVFLRFFDETGAFIGEGYRLTDSLVGKALDMKRIIKKTSSAEF